MVGIPVIMPVEAPGLARAVQIRRVAADRFRAVEGEGGQPGMAVPVEKFHRTVADEGRQRPNVKVDAGRLALPSPRLKWVLMYAECGGISATSACHSPDVAIDPNHGCPMTPDHSQYLRSMLSSPYPEQLPKNLRIRAVQDKCQKKCW